LSLCAALPTALALWAVTLPALAAGRLMPPPPAAASLQAGPPDTAAYALEVIAALPRYRPRAQVRGTIRLWGHGSPRHDFLGKLLRRWERDFHRQQPRVRIVADLYGSASAVGALYTGAGDLAILGEEVSPAAERAFERERHYAPTILEVATGSVDVNYYDYAQMVFVNRANPIDRLTLRQLARILGEPPDGSDSAPIRTWGELGLAGKWAQRMIQPYSWRFDQDFGLFLRDRVLGGSDRWNPRVRQFVTHQRPDGTIDDRGAQILQALARDPAGIAVSNIRFANPSVKVLELAAGSSGPYVLPGANTLISQQYPLTRLIPAVLDVPPGRPMNPAVREFLRFILSRDGQRALLEQSGYLPLGPRYVRAQLRKIAQLSRCRLAGGCLARPPSALRMGELESGPGQPLAGVIRVWGSPAFLRLGRRGAAGFRASHPRLRVTVHMTGSDTGMAGLFTGEADVALLARTATDSELQAFEWVFRHPPTCIAIPPVYVYLDSGPGAQPLTPVFLHYLLGQSGQVRHPCTSAR
jgi:phosphate transport system substrate-binding protein